MGLHRPGPAHVQRPCQFTALVDLCYPHTNPKSKRYPKSTQAEVPLKNDTRVRRPPCRSLRHLCGNMWIALDLKRIRRRPQQDPRANLGVHKFWHRFFVTVGMLLVDPAPIESLQPRAPFQSLANFPGLPESIFSSHALKHG